MYFKTKDQIIYYEKYGNSKKTILILPGWGNTRETFYQIINHFKQTYTIYIIDYPGFGKSKIPSKTLTIDDYSNLVIEFLNSLKIEKPIIIAHSFGGRIASTLIGYNKIKIDKLILIDVAGIKERKPISIIIKEKTYKTIKKIIKLFPKRKQEYLYKKLFNKFASPDYLALPKNMHETFKNIINEDLTKYFQNIQNETLILWGEKDKDTSLATAKKLNKLMKNSALITYPNATHYSYLQYPILTNNIIYEFIKEQQ